MVVIIIVRSIDVNEELESPIATFDGTLCAR